MDGAGVMHDLGQPLSGESWLREPAILSWENAANDAIGTSVRNVVIHEAAHKLDGLNGVVTGMPPLHRGMDWAAWTAAFAHAFEDLQGCLAAGRSLPIDGYGAEAPGEFFAVASERFCQAGRLESLTLWGSQRLGCDHRCHWWIVPSKRVVFHQGGREIFG